jgi:hypothetical protein
VVSNPKFLWTPITLEWASKTMKNSVKAVTTFDADLLMKTLPGVNQIPRFNEIMNNEDFELTEK